MGTAKYGLCVIEGGGPRSVSNLTQKLGSDYIDAMSGIKISLNKSGKLVISETKRIWGVLNCAYLNAEYAGIEDFKEFTIQPQDNMILVFQRDKYGGTFSSGQEYCFINLYYTCYLSDSGVVISGPDNFSERIVLNPGEEFIPGEEHTKLLKYIRSISINTCGVVSIYFTSVLIPMGGGMGNCLIGDNTGIMLKSTFRFRFKNEKDVWEVSVI